MMPMPANANVPNKISDETMRRRKNKGSIMADNNPVVARHVNAMDTFAYLILP